MNGLVVAEGLWDVEKFYDSFSLMVLLEKATTDIQASQGGQYTFDPRLLYHCVLTYLAGRVLSAGGCFGEPLRPTASILQGCQQANNMAKMVLHGLLERWHAEYRPSTLSQYVDDLAQRTLGTAAYVIKHFPAGAAAIKQGLSSLAFELSPKSALLSSRPAVGSALARELAARHITLQQATSARDLGIDNTAGARRSTCTMRKRFADTSRRFKKTRALAKKGARIAHLARVSCLAKAAWGHQAFGVAPSALQRLRSAVASALPDYKTGCCITTLMGLALDQLDPGHKLRAEIIFTWVDLWRQNPHRHRFWKRAWRKVAKDLQGRNENARWRRAISGISALQCTLLDLGWKIPQADEWIDDKQVTWVITGLAFDEVAVKHEIGQSIQRALWRKASQHHLGVGLENGAYLPPLAAYISSLKKAGRHQDASFITIAASAGCWTGMRRANAGYITLEEAICPLCKCGRDDEFHRIWECRSHGSSNSSGLVDPIWRQTDH